MGDPAFTSLKDAVESRLVFCVGEVHWQRAKIYFAALCQRRRNEQAAKDGQMRKEAVQCGCEAIELARLDHFCVVNFLRSLFASVQAAN